MIDGDYEVEIVGRMIYDENKGEWSVTAKARWVGQGPQGGWTQGEKARATAKASAVKHAYVNAKSAAGVAYRKKHR